MNKGQFKSTPSNPSQKHAQTAGTRAVLEVFAAEDPTLVVDDFWPAAYGDAETQDPVPQLSFDEETTIPTLEPPLPPPAKAFSVMLEPIEDKTPTIPDPSARHQPVSRQLYGPAPRLARQSSWFRWGFLSLLIFPLLWITL